MCTLRRHTSRGAPLVEGAQKNFLQDAKQRLLRQHPGLTWDQLATLAQVEPRAFKTYRMPEQSPDYRVMPKLVRSKIEELVRAAERAPTIDASEGLVRAVEAERAPFESILVPALAALVLRQTRLALIEGRPISGVDRYAGDQ